MLSKLKLAGIILLICGALVAFYEVKIYNKEKKHQKALKEIKDNFIIEKNDLISQYGKEIEDFEKDNLSLTQLNRRLTSKVNNYEKRLSYSDRTFLDAARIISESRYKGGSKKRDSITQ